METKAKDAYEALASALSTGQGKNDCKVTSQQLNATEQASDESVKRYEQLIHAAKAFVFTVIVRDGHSVCTIHYPGVLQVTGYTEEEYAAQPLLWCNMIYGEDKEIVFQQIERLLRGETPPPIKHRIIHKNGSIRWLRNTSVPVFNSKGRLIAYDGLIVDISEIEFAEAEQEHQIAELTSALAMVKTLHSLLPICCSCKKIRDDNGYWQQIEAYIEGHYSNISFTHGICPACAKRLYPQYYEATIKAA
jgi:PAS domain S-box-containing protein